VATGFDHDAVFEKGGNLSGESGGGAHVGDGDLCSASAQKKSCRKAGFTEADDENFFAFQLHTESPFQIRLDWDGERSLGG
jgi:hypothetical protein